MAVRDDALVEALYEIHDEKLTVPADVAYSHKVSRERRWPSSAQGDAPLAPGDDGDDFRMAFEQRILPALDQFAPDMLLVSAGFDGPVFCTPATRDLCAVMLGHAIRSDALAGLFAPSSDRVAASMPIGAQ